MRYMVIIWRSRTVTVYGLYTSMDEADARFYVKCYGRERGVEAIEVMEMRDLDWLERWVQRCSHWLSGRRVFVG